MDFYSEECMEDVEIAPFLKGRLEEHCAEIQQPVRTVLDEAIRSYLRDRREDGGFR